MMSSSTGCRRWVLTAVWIMATAACLGGREVELNWTDNELQDTLVDRRSLNVIQSSSQEGD